MRAILLGAAPLPLEEARALVRRLSKAGGVLSGPALRVGVDGGLAFWGRAGLRAQVAVGDWDSLPGRDRGLLKGIPFLTLPRGKDRSDLFHAARAALALGATELVCVGVTGGRPDHTLAALYDLAELAAGAARRVSAFDPGAEYRFFSSRGEDSWTGRLPLGSTVSFFALGGPARGVTLRGFRYPLTRAMLDCSSHGLSNKTARAEVQVRVGRGELVMMVSRGSSHHD